MERPLRIPFVSNQIFSMNKEHFRFWFFSPRSSIHHLLSHQVLWHHKKDARTLENHKNMREKLKFANFVPTFRMYALYTGFYGSEKLQEKFKFRSQLMVGNVFL